MPGVVGQQPIGLAGHGGEENRNVSCVANEVPVGSDEVLVRIRDDFRRGQLNETMVVADEFLGFGGRQDVRVKKQVLLHLVADDLREDQFADARGAERECGFVEAPR
jgi:hypothetical protein